MLDDVGEEEMRLDCGCRKALEMRVAPQDLDPSQDLLRCFLAELRQFGQLAVLRHALQVVQCLNAERVVDHLNPGGVESRNAKELQQSFRNALAELV